MTRNECEKLCVIAADFRTGETRGAKLEASTGEAKRAAELSEKEIQDSERSERGNS